MDEKHQYHSEGGHWYTVEVEDAPFGGEPVTIARCIPELIPGATGTERRPTLADARKNNWFPSVTTIAKLLAKPGLQNWKSEQLLMAALTLPRIQGENDNEFVSRIIKDSEAWTATTSDVGKNFHKELSEAILEPLYQPETEPCKRLVATVRAWLKANRISQVKSEVSFAHPYGFAGTADLIGRIDTLPVVADLKTTALARFKAPYQEWREQLGAYALGLGYTKTVECFHIVCDRESGETEIIEIPQEDLEVAQHIFVHTLQIWRARNEYWPQLNPIRFLMKGERDE